MGPSGGRVAPGLVGVRGLGLGRARGPREGCHVRRIPPGSFASPRPDDGDWEFAVFRGACALGVGVPPGMRRAGWAVVIRGPPPSIVVCGAAAATAVLASEMVSTPALTMPTRERTAVV